MNVNEFSIACKLINLKLRGFEIPKVLPPTLLASLAAVGGTPTRTPTTGMSPSGSIAALHAAGPPPVPPQPSILQHPQYATVPGVVPHQPPGRPAMPPQPVIPSQPLIQAGQPLTQAHIPPVVPPPPAIMQQQQMQQTVAPMMVQQQQQPMVMPTQQMMGMAQPVMMQQQPAMIPQQQQQQSAYTMPAQVPGLMSAVPNAMASGVMQDYAQIPMQTAPVQPAQLIHQDSQSLLTGPLQNTSMTMVQQIPQNIPVQSVPVSAVTAMMAPTQILPIAAVPPTNIPALPTPPSGTQSRSMSISERAPSIESP